MFLESFMLWNGNTSPKNIGLTIVGYLYKRGIEKNQMGYASAVGLVLLVLALLINVVQLVANGTFKKEVD
jgi:arabinosaccharide transport system permease protein